MSSSERLDLNLKPVRLSGEFEFLNGASATERSMAVFTAASSERNRIDSGRILSALGLQNFALVGTGQPGDDSPINLASSDRLDNPNSLQRPIMDDDTVATVKRIEEGSRKNLPAAEFFQSQTYDLACAKAGSGWKRFELKRALLEIVFNKWCMGADDTTYENIEKDWNVLKKFGVTEKDVQNIIDQAQEKGISGSTSCLVT